MYSGASATCAETINTPSAAGGGGAATFAIKAVAPRRRVVAGVCEGWYHRPICIIQQYVSILIFGNPGMTHHRRPPLGPAFFFV